MSGKLTKFKLKKNLAEEIKKEEQGGKDNRFLPYYNMKEGEKVKILIVPDVNGNLWKKYETHGPSLKLRGVKPLLCRHRHGGGDCPVCQKAYDLLDQSKSAGDESLKDEAKRWFPKSTTIMSVIVLDAPFDYPASDDHNEVKLMYVPYAVEALIKNALAEGQIDEDSLTTTPLFIKKTKNKGGQAAYDNSYFDRKEVSEAELAVFEDDDLVVEQFNFDELDLIPELPTLEFSEEWLAEAERSDEKAKRSTGKTENEDDAPKAPTSLRDRLKAKKDDKVDDDKVDEVEETEEQEMEEESEPQPQPEPVSRADSLRARLNASRAK